MYITAFGHTLCKCCSKTLRLIVGVKSSGVFLVPDDPFSPSFLFLFKGFSKFMSMTGLGFVYELHIIILKNIDNILFQKNFDSMYTVKMYNSYQQFSIECKPQL